ncbi:MAG: DUF4384 domain-containing protein, partial [Planctomycetota bacterium]
MIASRAIATMFVLFTSSLACDALTHVYADGKPTTIENAREQVDSAGRITDDDLRQRTGWQTMHAFQWTIELEQPQGSGTFDAVSKKRVFRHGDVFRLRFETATDLYVYVLVRNADMSETILLPEAAEAVPLVRRGDITTLPALRPYFAFTPPAGTERLRLVVATEALPWVSSRKFWELENGDVLSDEQQEALAQLKSVRSRNLGAAIKQLSTHVKSIDSLDAAQQQIEQGALARGVEIIAVEAVSKAE